MRILLSLLLSVHFITSAQTNSLSTNATNATTNDVQAKQLAAVRKAMPGFFLLTQDPVDRTKTISLKEDIRLGTKDEHMKMDVVCYIHPPDVVPVCVFFRIISVSESFRFLDHHKFVIRYDEKIVEYEDLEDTTKTFSDSTVAEQFSPRFDLNQIFQVGWKQLCDSIL